MEHIDITTVLLAYMYITGKNYYWLTRRRTPSTAAQLPPPLKSQLSTLVRHKARSKYPLEQRPLPRATLLRGFSWTSTRHGQTAGQRNGHGSGQSLLMRHMSCLAMVNLCLTRKAAQYSHALAWVLGSAVLEGRRERSLLHTTARLNSD